MQIQAAKLKQILAVLKEGIATKTTLPITRNVRLGEGLAIATNLERMIFIHVPELAGDFVACPPHDTLFKMVSRFPNDLLTLTLDAEKDLSLDITSAHGPRSRLTCLPSGDFPAPGTPKLQRSASIDGDFFIRCLLEVAVNAASEEARPALKAVYLALGDNATLVAADGFRLGVMPLGKALAIMEKPDDVLPTITLAALSRYDEDGQEVAAVRTCRVCGCTEDNACNDGENPPCSWVGIDLCSYCHDTDPDGQNAEPEDPEDKALREPAEQRDEALPVAPAWDVSGLIIPLATVMALCKVWKMLDVFPENARSLIQSRRLVIEYGPEAIRFRIAAHCEGQPMEVTMVSQVVHGSFPNYSQLIPASTGQGVVFQAQEMYARVRMLAPIAVDASNIIRFQWGDDQMHVSARASETGEAGGPVACKTQGEGKIAFNAKYLLDYFKGRTGTVLLEVSSPSTPAVFTHDGHGTFVLMPMYVQWGDAAPEAAPAPGPAEAEPAAVQ
jgi:DNA polymerase III sliding clamp (beta) subunit (PCNA family)